MRVISRPHGVTEMASTQFVGNPVYIVRSKITGIQHITRAKSENKALAKIIFKQGGTRDDYFVYQR